MPTSAMTSKGQLTVPAEVRAELRLRAGDRVRFEPLGDGAYRLSPVRGDVRALRGAIRYDGPPVSVEDMNRAIADALAERSQRTAP